MATAFPNITMTLYENETLYGNESTNSSILSLEEFIHQFRGPNSLPKVDALTMTVVYMAILITGVLGNALVCLVIIRNSKMHNATNFYLFSLAVSDLTFLIVGVPFEVALFWQWYPWVLGEFICKSRALVSEMASYTSVLTIVAFSMERYLAICHPVLSVTMPRPSRAVRIITVLWLSAFIFATPFYILTNVHYLYYPPKDPVRLDETAFCAMFAEDMNGWPLYEASFLIFFLFPMAVICVLYILMAFTIHTRIQSSMGRSAQSEIRRLQSKKAIIRMLAAVVFCFFASWAGFHAQRLLYIHAKEFVSQYNSIFYITGILYYFSSTVNPILYNVMSARYRIAFKQTVLGCVGRSKTAGSVRRGCVSTHGREFTRDASSRETSMYEVTRPRSNTLVRAEHNGSAKTISTQKWSMCLINSEQRESNVISSPGEQETCI